MNLPGGIAALTSGQSRIWFAEQLTPGRYIIQRALHLSGDVDVSVVGHSIELLISRHDALRSVYRRTSRGLEQIVLPSGHNVFKVFEAFNSADVERHIGRVREEGFDLENELPIRVDFLQCSDGSARLVLTVHHLAFDGWSMDVFFREFTLAYRVFAKGAKPELLAAPSYLQYAASRAVEDHHSSRLYWRTTLRGSPPVTLPTDDLPHSGLVSGAHAIPIVIPESTAGRIMAIGRAKRCTVYMVLLALYSAALARYSGSAEVIVATVTSGRERSEDQQLIGFLVNTIPIRILCRGSASFSSLLGDVRETCLSAWEHSRIPYNEIVAVSSVKRFVGRPPLAQALFDYGQPRLSPELPSANIAEVPIVPTVTRLDMEMHLALRGGEISGYLLASGERFAINTVSRIRDQFVRLAGKWMPEPEMAFKDVL